MPQYREVIQILAKADGDQEEALDTYWDSWWAVQAFTWADALQVEENVLDQAPGQVRVTGVMRSNGMEDGWQ